MNKDVTVLPGEQKNVRVMSYKYDENLVITFFKKFYRTDIGNTHIYYIDIFQRYFEKNIKRTCIEH